MISQAEKQIVKACYQVALDIEAGKLRMSKIGRSYVFRDTGSTCCIFGHVIERAGLKRKMVPFYQKMTYKSRAPRWVENVSAYAGATGNFPPLKIQPDLEDLQLMNDTTGGEERKIGLVAQLRKLATTILDSA